MVGVVRKRHCLLVAREFGWWKAVKLILSRKPVALAVLMR